MRTDLKQNKQESLERGRVIRDMIESFGVVEGREGTRQVCLPRAHSLKLGSCSFRTVMRKFYLRPISLLPAV